MAYTVCPGCSGELGSLLNHKTIRLCDTTKLGECRGCGGLVGTIDERDLPQFVVLEFHTGATDVLTGEEEDTRYFDLEIVNPFRNPKVRRVHGWYNPRTKRVVQFG